MVCLFNIVSVAAKLMKFRQFFFNTLEATVAENYDECVHIEILMNRRLIDKTDLL